MAEFPQNFCFLLPALESQTSSTNWHGKHVKLMRYLYPKSRQGEDRVHFLKALPEGEAFKGLIMQPFPLEEIKAALVSFLSFLVDPLLNCGWFQNWQQPPKLLDSFQCIIRDTSFQLLNIKYWGNHKNVSSWDHFQLWGPKSAQPWWVLTEELASLWRQGGELLKTGEETHLALHPRRFDAGCRQSCCSKLDGEIPQGPVRPLRFEERW